ncbi:MAG: hypothetical protein QOI55_683 [Actinomycetota bacterium]|nr:hypothetical protein [Actinomycetota bacterium]
MATVRHAEKTIFDVEGFKVRLLYSEPGRKRGRDVRGDREDVPAYRYERAARDDFTVAAWIQKRFSRSYPGFDVEVLDRSGHPVHGRTKLATVRQTYN